MSKPPFVYVTYINTTPEKLWGALTDGEFTRRYCGGRRIQSDWNVERPSRVTFELQRIGSVVKLTLIHDDFESASATFETTRHGWPAIMSSLKSLLEVGSPLPFQGLGFGPSSKEPGRL
jgi:uncharacterized protein YndB with AHSA1/START domain